MNEKHQYTNRVLTTIALILAIICMVIFIITAHRLHEAYSGIQDAFEGPTFPSHTSEEGIPDPAGLPSEPWIEEGDQVDTYKYCDTTPAGEPYCEEITE